MIDVEHYQAIAASASMDAAGGTPPAAANFVDIPNSAFIEPDNELVKTGTGTLTLSNSNTYAGATIVNAGEILVNGKVLDSAITVNSGATLGGDGSVPATTLQGGGFLSPGGSPGVLTARNLSLAIGATFMEQLGGTAAGSQYDQITSQVSPSELVLSITVAQSCSAAPLPSPTPVRQTSSGHSYLK